MSPSKQKNTVKHPARVWLPWCVIRRYHFDVSFLPCDRGRHPPWKENGLRRKEREKWKLPDWQAITVADYKSYVEEDDTVGQNIDAGDCADGLTCTVKDTLFWCLQSILIHFLNIVGFVSLQCMCVLEGILCHTWKLWLIPCYLSLDHHAYMSVYCSSICCMCTFKGYKGLGVRYNLWHLQSKACLESQWAYEVDSHAIMK